MIFCNPKKIFYVLLAAFAVLLTGCTPADPYKTISTSIQITFHEDNFTPRQWKVPSGENIELTLSNPTTQDHAWIIMARPVEIPLQDEDRQFIYFETRSSAGTTQKISFYAPNAPGEYDILLDPTAAAEAGWVGKLVVYQSSFLKQIGKFPTPDAADSQK